MNPGTTEYWLDERVGVGDPDYPLAEAFVAPAQRPVFRLLFGLRAEVQDLLLSTTDPDPTLVRLGWWRQEWERLAAAEPRHPLTRGLARHGRHDAADLDPALTALAELLQMSSCETDQALMALMADIGRSFGRVEAVLFELDTASPGAWQEIFAADLILNLGRLARLGRAVVPLNLGAELQLSRESIQQRPEQLLALQQTLIRRHAPQALPGAAPSWVYRSIRTRRLRALLTRGGEPGALSRLLAAWQGRRQLRAPS